MSCRRAAAAAGFDLRETRKMSATSDVVWLTKYVTHRPTANKMLNCRVTGHATEGWPA